MNKKELLIEEKENVVYSYWNGKGKHQVEHDLMWRLIPESGEFICPENIKLETAIESVRKLSRVYYDFNNNGCCNSVESVFEMCYECGGSGWEYNRWDEEEEERDCQCCGGDGKIEIEEKISEQYEDIVSDLESYVDDESLTKIIVNYDSDKLEEFADKVINESWLRFINLK